MLQRRIATGLIEGADMQRATATRRRLGPVLESSPLIAAKLQICSTNRHPAPLGAIWAVVIAFDRSNPRLRACMGTRMRTAFAVTT